MQASLETESGAVRRSSSWPALTAGLFVLFLVCSPAATAKSARPQPYVAAPGPITITHYAADGTVESVEHPADTPTLAGLGGVGAAALSDPAGSGLGPVLPAACCSATGADAVDVTRDIRSAFGSLLARFHHRVYWTWSYPSIGSVNVSCYATDVNGAFVHYEGCGGSGNYYYWAGSYRGGHYSFRQGTFRNCVLWYACIQDAYPWIKVWVNANGAWASDQGG